MHDTMSICFLSRIAVVRPGASAESETIEPAASRSRIQTGLMFVSEVLLRILLNFAYFSRGVSSVEVLRLPVPRGRPVQCLGCNELAHWGGNNLTRPVRQRVADLYHGSLDEIITA